MISVDLGGTIKPTILVRLAVRCALVALLGPTTFGMAGDGAGRPVDRPATPGVARQADTEPPTIALPVVDGKGIRFTRLSTDEGLSQTKVSQIVQDDQGFMWFGTQYGLNRYDGYKFKLFVHDPKNPKQPQRGVNCGALQGFGWARSGWDAINFSINSIELTETFARHPVPFVKRISQETAPEHCGWRLSRAWSSLTPGTGTIRQLSYNPTHLSSLGVNVKSTGEDKEGRFRVVNVGHLDEVDRKRGRPLHVGTFLGTRVSSGFLD